MKMIKKSKSDDEEEDGKKICINKFNTAFY